MKLNKNGEKILELYTAYIATPSETAKNTLIKEARKMCVVSGSYIQKLFSTANTSEFMSMAQKSNFSAMCMRAEDEIIENLKDYFDNQGIPLADASRRGKVVSLTRMIGIKRNVSHKYFNEPIVECSFDSLANTSGKILKYVEIVGELLANRYFDDNKALFPSEALAMKVTKSYLSDCSWYNVDVVYSFNLDVINEHTLPAIALFVKGTPKDIPLT